MGRAVRPLHTGGMPVDPYASLSLRVGDAERARAESVLQEAYCTGRLDEVELDERLGLAMRAENRRELSAALAGLPRPAPMPFAHPAASPSRPDATVLGGVAHLSALFTWIVGPLVCYAVATPGTPARRESARAFNFQAIAGGIGLVTVILASILLPGEIGAVLVMLGWLAWFSLTIISGARAIGGQKWLNPVTRVIRWEALDTSGR